MFEDFTATFAESMENFKADLMEFKSFTNPIIGLEKVGLWQKKFSSRELAKMKAEDEAAERKAEEEEEKKLEAEDAVAATKVAE